MKTTKKILTIGAIILTLGTTIIACSTTKKVNTDAASIEVATVQDDFIIEKSGAQMWGETCNRCHLAPSPADYNDTDWETISLHMRVRANLTENEITKIEAFLKSAN
jgi:cytochrome c5